MRTRGVRVLRLVGLGVCGANPVVIFANDDSNPWAVVVALMAIVSVDGWGETRPWLEGLFSD